MKRQNSLVLFFFCLLFQCSTLGFARPINIQLDPKYHGGGASRGRTDALFPRTDPKLIGRTYQLLEVMDKVFAEAGITYWADFGVLLGAVRNGSMIPWNDDGDVGVYLSDKEKILALDEEFRKYGMWVLDVASAGYLCLRWEGKNYPFIDIFLYEVDQATSDHKIRPTGDPYKWWPNTCWYALELAEMERIKYGPIELNAPWLGLLRRLLKHYGDDYLDKAAYWGHQGFNQIREQVQVTDFSPGEYVLEELSIPLDGLRYESDRISFGALLHDPVTEHVRVLGKLLDGVWINECVEFGLGKGTKCLLERCVLSGGAGTGAI